MQAVTVIPGTAGSAKFENVAEPGPELGSVVVEALAVGMVIFGSVNANRRHYYRGAKVLARAERSWLEQLVTRRVGPDDVAHALSRTPDDIKVVMEFAQP